MVFSDVVCVKTRNGIQHLMVSSKFAAPSALHAIGQYRVKLHASGKGVSLKGILAMQVRVGNARGNILFSPDIRLAYIRAVSTSEGEVYFEVNLIPAPDSPYDKLLHSLCLPG